MPMDSIEAYGQNHGGSSKNTLEATKIQEVINRIILFGLWPSGPTLS